MQTDGAAVLKERLPKEARLNGTCSSGADDDRNDHYMDFPDCLLLLLSISVSLLFSLVFSFFSVFTLF